MDRPVSPEAVAHQWRRLRALPQPPWLHAEVARRMAERLPLVRLKPSQVLDWYASTSSSADVLREAYPKAEVVEVEDAIARASRRKTSWWGRLTAPSRSQCVEHDLPAGRAQLVWANMMLHGCANPPALMQSWLRALAPEGFVMFSTLGPGSLRGLQQLFEAHGWGPAFAPFVDMHDLGDMLVNAGFATPVMDQELITLHWADAAALLMEVRSWGGNVAPRRFGGLRGRGWRNALLTGLKGLSNPAGRPELVLELVYGHAFKPLPKVAAPGETKVGLDEMRQILRRGSSR